MADIRLDPGERGRSPAAKPRVLVAHNVYYPQHIGGAEIVMQRQVAALHRRGYAVRVLAGWVPGLGQQPPLGEGEADIPVYRLPFRSWDQATDTRQANGTAYYDALLDLERPDIVHAHNLRGLGTDLIAAARARGIPVLVTMHDHWWHCHWATRLRPDGTLCINAARCGIDCGAAAAFALPLRLRRDSLLRDLDQAWRTIAPSKALAEAHVEAGLQGDRIVVCSYGIDIATLPPPRQPHERPAGQPLHFVFVGGLATHKGVEDLLAAAVLLDSDVSLRGRWRLSLAGDGGLRGAIENGIRQHGLEHAMSCLGKLSHDDVMDVIAKADVVVLPSRWPENEPVTLLEGAACGAALIATNIGGSRDLVVDGHGGQHVPPRDPHALAVAMSTYVQQPDLAAAHGAWNLARRKVHDETNTIDRLETLYDEAMRGVDPVAPPPVVICGGAPSDLMRTLVDRLYETDRPDRPWRLLWHADSRPADWSEALLYWDWGGDRGPRERALLAGLPVLGPDGGGPGSSVVRYGSPLEAVSALHLFLASPDLLKDRRRNGRDRLLGVWHDSGPLSGDPSPVDDLEALVRQHAERLAREAPDFAAALTAASPEQKQ